MPNESRHHETYQQWFARKSEERRTEFYTDSLINIPKTRDYPLPDFDLDYLYSDSNKKSIPAIVEQISVAISRCDYDSFKKLMGPSMVPSQILHHQRTQQRYWIWLQVNRLLQFYLRAEYLFWGAQLKFFYEEMLDNVKLVEEVPVTNPKPGEAKVIRQPSSIGLRYIKKYKETILPKCFNESHLQIDVFWGKLHEQENRHLNSFLNSLTQHKNTISYRRQAFRRKASSATRHPLAAIMKTQLLLSSEKDAWMCIRKEDSPLLRKIFRCYLSTVDPKHQRRFTDWLDNQLDRKVDVAIIGESIHNSIMSYINNCEDLLESQNNDAEQLLKIEDELLKNFHDNHIKKSGIANLSLQDEHFNVVDKIKKAVVPMLHYAMRVYADAIEKDDIPKAFKIIELLIARGASPFQRLVVTPFVVENTFSTSAFDYAGLQPNWEILSCVLRYTLTFTFFSEKLRISLEKYAIEMEAAPKVWQTRMFQSKKKREESLTFVSQLTELLHTDDKYDDTQLLNAISNIIKNHTSHFSNSQLHRLLKNLFKDKELICVPVSEKKEMEVEMQPLESSSPPDSPSSHSLSLRNIFFRPSIYSRIEELPEIKEEETDDLILEDGSDVSDIKEEIDDLELDENRSNSPTP
jgi:hypothetical protein